jgi:hypothetical protein
MQRRHFLVLGAAGAATLAVAGWWTWIRRPGAPSAEQDAAAIVAAIVPSMLDGALPTGPDRGIAVAETVDNVGRAIAGLPPASRAELAQLFGLLALPAGRRLFAGVPSPWPEASAAEVGAFLDAWQRSGWSLKRSAYDGLHQLVLAAWYGNPRSWGPIGYPGPPRLG